MHTRNARKGFTLVEMLVVIAIIAILAAALFPAIQGAIEQAKEAALKNKGRAIWTAIMTANMEREPLGESTVWPADVTKKDGTTVKFDTVGKYFTFLMSEGGDDPNAVEIAVASSDRIVPDLSFDTLAGAGVKPAETSDTEVKDLNIAWHVGALGDTSPSDMPFLITRNVTATDDKIVKNAVAKLDLGGIAPFKTGRALWVVRGGGVLAARKKYLDWEKFAGSAYSTSNDVPILPNQTTSTGATP